MYKMALDISIYLSAICFGVFLAYITVFHRPVSTLSTQQYAACVVETINAQQAADKAEFVREVTGMPRGDFYKMLEMIPIRSAAEIEMERQANFMRIKELCRLKLP
jgi:hypothetical protein